MPANFRPARLAGSEPPGVGEPTTVVGFGVAKEGEPKTGGALRAAGQVVRAPISKILLWTEGPEGEAGACSGDSGGPIFAADNESVLAIVAWTNGASGGKCGAVTQGPLIAPLRDWIESIVAQWRR